MNDQPLRVIVPIAPEEALRRLTAFGRDWRESRLPAETRAAGYYGAQVRVAPPRFTLFLESAIRGPHFELLGEVRPAPGGAEVVCAVAEGRRSRISGLVFLAVVFLLIPTVFACWGHRGWALSDVLLGAFTATFFSFVQGVFAGPARTEDVGHLERVLRAALAGEAPAAAAT